MSKQSFVVCVGFPGEVTELASPQLHALSLKAHLQRSLVAVGPSRDYSHAGARPCWHAGRLAELAQSQAEKAKS